MNPTNKPKKYRKYSLIPGTVDQNAVPEDITTVISRINSIFEAVNNGASINDFKNHIEGLRHKIVRGKLQRIIIEQCGKEKLMFILHAVCKTHVVRLEDPHQEKPHKKKSKRKRISQKENPRIIKKEDPHNEGLTFSRRTYGSFSQNTRKSWGSTYRPARIKR